MGIIDDIRCAGMSGEIHPEEARFLELASIVLGAPTPPPADTPGDGAKVDHYSDAVRYSALTETLLMDAKQRRGRQGCHK